ncbi:MAG: hypothetical protein K8T90_18060 [Planctomycetes bacterium]|nr:hypothetical protein [Planctomycetota bacterium]
MNLFQLSSTLAALCGAVGLGVALASKGAVVMTIGILGGLVGGWFAGPFLLLSAFVVAIAFQEGPRSALDFLRRRGR